MVKAKSQPARLLSYGQSISTPVAMTITILAGANILSCLLQIINFGISSGTNHYVKGMTIVQLEDGSTSIAKSLGPNERTNETIKKFISDSMVKMFNWDGLIQANDNGENITKPDKGIDVKTTKGMNKKIPTKAWLAAFALSDNQDFRANFLKKLAEIIPEGVFNGQTQVSLVPRHLSEPRKISDGKWEVDLIATLVTFNKDKNEGKGITFNKTITVEAIDTPQSPPRTTELAQEIYSTRKSGLEIIEILDYELGKNKVFRSQKSGVRSQESE